MRPAGKNKSGKTLWLCRCECGSEVAVRTDCLRRGITRSCGCLQKEALQAVVRTNDLTGQKFGRLIAIEIVGRDEQNNALWHCRCDCGNEHIVRASSLTYGSVRSCGCLQREKSANASRTHGLSVDKSGNTPRLYGIWRNMKQRCSNQKASKFQNYGGRGICVCNEWQDYVPFHKWAIANGYRDDLTIERIDNDGDYSPSNCRWAAYRQQNFNKRDNRLIAYNGVTKPLGEWAALRGIKWTTLRSRLDDYGWSVEKALTTPVGKHARRRSVR